MDGPTFIVGFLSGGLSLYLANLAYSKNFFRKEKIEKLLERIKTEAGKLKQVKERTTETEDMVARERNQEEWNGKNNTKFPDELQEIIGIYKSGFLPLTHELEALEQKYHEFLCERVAFGYNSPEKKRIFSILLERIQFGDLLKFYKSWGWKTPWQEEVITGKIKLAHKHEIVSIEDMKSVAFHEGKLSKYVEDLEKGKQEQKKFPHMKAV